MTCLCLTRNRPQWLPQAIRSYQLQTHVNRELLILSDGDDVRHLVPANDSTIRHVHLDGAPEIGEKRNFGCNLAAGEIIAHWDDDDYSAPDRLADQVVRMLATGKPVTGYSSMRFTDGTNWWQYTGSPGYALGTSLCYRKDWWVRNPFPAKQVGEDNDFVAAARARGAIVSVEAGDLMYATIHERNTSPRNLKGANWRRIS